MATRYWVGGGSSANWNATGNTNWGTASNTRDNASVPTSSDAVIFDNSAFGNSPCTINATASAASIDASAYTNTITHNASVTLTVSGNVTLPTAGVGTYTASSSTSSIVIIGTSSFNTGGNRIGNFSYQQNSGTLTLLSNVSFIDSKTCSFLSTQAFSVVNMNGKTISGFSSTSRVLIAGSPLGTQRQFTLNGGTFANADFRDILFNNGGSNLDLSAITGLSGDCGGNGMTGGGSLTMTSTTTQNITMSTAKNWSDATIWTSRVPLPQDDVTATGWTAGTLTADMPRLGRTIDFSGATAGRTFDISSINNTIFGSLDLTRVSTLTAGTTTTFTFNGRGSGQTINTAGLTFTNILTYSLVTGDLTYSASVANGSNNTTLSSGTLNTAGYTHSSQSFTVSSGATLNASSSTFNINGGFGLTIWSCSATATLTGTPTITFTKTGASSDRIFAGGGKTYADLRIAGGASTGVTTIQQSNTFGTITQVTGVPFTLKLTSGTTQTITTTPPTLSGTAGNLITLNATAGTPPILNYTGSGKVNLDYLKIQGVNVTPANTWYYGNNSQDGLGVGFGGETSSGGVITASDDGTKNRQTGVDFSVEAWVIARTSGGSASGRIWDKTDGSATKLKGYVFGVNAALTSFAVTAYSGGSSFTTSSNSGITANTLSHLVFSKTLGAAPKIYINGTETGYSATATNNCGDDTGTGLNIGATPTRTGTWDGQIFLVRIYRNVALSAGEVTSLYNSGVLDKTLSNSATAKATQTWLLNDDSNATQTLSEEGDTGTITSPAKWVNTGWNSGVGSTFSYVLDYSTGNILRATTTNQKSIKRLGVISNQEILELPSSFAFH